MDQPIGNSYYLTNWSKELVGVRGEKKNEGLQWLSCLNWDRVK
jgi:hypothetical protein